MITRTLDYHRPASLDEALAALARGNGDAVALGGGTWVVPEMTHGIRRPSHVVDLRRAGLGAIAVEGGDLVVGATATYTQIATDPAVAANAPALATLAAGVTGGAQVRNQATAGGSACYGSPSSDVPGALVGLGARLRLASAGGTREVDAERFFVGAFATALAADELLTAIAVPAAAAGERQGFYKFKLCESSWPIATSCCRITLGADGALEAGRLAVGGVSSTPYLVDLTGLVGSRIDRGALAEIARLAEAGASDPYTDVLASGEYRRQIAGAIAKRALAAATA